jgi:tRNA(Ile)-lysidine synthase
MKSNKTSYSVLKKVRDTVDKFDMLDKDEKVLVAFSGGPDSYALLYLLDELKEKYGVSICAGHVNHMLRGEESLKDEDEVKRRCKQLKIDCSVVKKDVRKLKKQGESLEEAARRIRYKALEKMAEEFGADKIATGHNRDDQAETVLLRIIKGAGEAGLSGIPPTRNLNSGIKIIRPLINVSRKEIDKYLKVKNITPRIDSSNVNTTFLRNKIRHELIPYLQKYNPKIKDTLLRTSQISREASEHIKQNARKILEQISTSLPGSVKIDINKLLACPRILHNRILVEAYRELKGDIKHLNSSHFEEMGKILNSKKANLVVKLSSGIEAVKEYSNLIIRKTAKHTESRKKSYKYTLEEEGGYPIPEIGRTLQVKILGKSELLDLNFDDSSQVYFDAKKLKFPLVVRNRKEGDRFSPFGMQKKKKLKDFFIDEKVPLKKRDKTPIVVDNAENILWVAGYRRSNIGIINKDTSRVVKIELSN